MIFIIGAVGLLAWAVWHSITQPHTDPHRHHFLKYTPRGLSLGDLRARKYRKAETWRNGGQ